MRETWLSLLLWRDESALLQPPVRAHIAIQLKNHPETIPLLMQQLVAFLSAHPIQTFYRGKLFIVEPHRIRIRQ